MISMRGFLQITKTKGEQVKTRRVNYAWQRRVNFKNAELYGADSDAKKDIQLALKINWKLCF